MKRILAIVLCLVLILGCSMSFATTNANVSIVNPTAASITATDNLLVSIKIAEAGTYKISVYEVMKPATVEGGLDTAITLETYNANLALDAESRVAWKYRQLVVPETVTYTASLSYYTKKIESITPGVYYIKVETLDANGATVASNTAYAEITAKVETSNQTASTNTSGALQFLKTILTSIFGK